MFREGRHLLGDDERIRAVHSRYKRLKRVKPRGVQREVLMLMCFKLEQAGLGSKLMPFVVHSASNDPNEVARQEMAVLAKCFRKGIAI